MELDLQLLLVVSKCAEPSQAENVDSFLFDSDGANLLLAPPGTGCATFRLACGPELKGGQGMLNLSVQQDSLELARAEAPANQQVRSTTNTAPTRCRAGESFTRAPPTGCRRRPFGQQPPQQMGSCQLGRATRADLDPAWARV